MRLVHPWKTRVVDERVVEGQVRVVRAADRPAPALVARRVAPAPEPRAHNERDAVRDDGVEDAPRGRRVAAHDQTEIRDAHVVRERRLVEEPPPLEAAVHVDRGPRHALEAEALAPVAARPPHRVAPRLRREEDADLVRVDLAVVAAERRRVHDVRHRNHAVSQVEPSRLLAVRADPGVVHLEDAEVALLQ